MKKFLANSKFFFIDFHKGTVNIILHLISLSVFVFGWMEKDLLLFLIGFLVIDEMGHIYNYFFLYKKDALYNPVRMLPYQAIYGIPAGLVLLWIAGFI